MINLASRITASTILVVAIITGCVSEPLAHANDNRAGGSEVGSDRRLIQHLKGRWAYAQSCGWEHTATLELQPARDGMLGQWSDGHKLRGSHGKLAGEVRDGNLFLRTCQLDVKADHADACPNLGEALNYVEPGGDTIVWYRRFGDHGWHRYLTLHRVVMGKDIPRDTHCPEAR